MKKEKKGIMYEFNNIIVNKKNDLLFFFDNGIINEDKLGKIAILKYNKKKLNYTLHLYNNFFQKSLYPFGYFIKTEINKNIVNIEEENFNIVNYKEFEEKYENRKKEFEDKKNFEDVFYESFSEIDEEQINNLRKEIDLIKRKNINSNNKELEINIKQNKNNKNINIDTNSDTNSDKSINQKEILKDNLFLGLVKTVVLNSYVNKIGDIRNILNTNIDIYKNILDLYFSFNKNKKIYGLYNVLIDIYGLDNNKIEQKFKIFEGKTKNKEEKKIIEILFRTKDIIKENNYIKYSKEDYVLYLILFFKISGYDFVIF